MWVWNQNRKNEGVDWGQVKEGENNSLWGRQVAEGGQKRKKGKTRRRIELKTQMPVHSRITRSCRREKNKSETYQKSE